MFGSVSEHFANLRLVKRCKTCVSGLNALFWGTEVVKHPFYSIGPKMMFVSVSEHFANLRHVKGCKTCVSGLNALFWGTEVVKHPFYSIGPNVMFGSVPEHFANLQHVKDAKLVFRPECTILGYRSCKASILLH
jgi:acid stress-induced BolA-like protein IbaG/YrbA